MFMYNNMKARKRVYYIKHCYVRYVYFCGGR